MFSHNMAGAPNLLSFAQRKVNYKRLNGTCNVIAHGKADNNPTTTTTKKISFSPLSFFLSFFLLVRNAADELRGGNNSKHTHKTLCVCIWFFRCSTFSSVVFELTPNRRRKNMIFISVGSFVLSCSGNLLTTISNIVYGGRRRRRTGIL